MQSTSEIESSCWISSYRQGTFSIKTRVRSNPKDPQQLKRKLWAVGKMLA
jgi:hypothetical protein